MSEAKVFETGVILSITTRLAPKGGIEAIREILLFMTREKHLNELELIDAAKPCKESLLKQLPWTEDVEPEGVGPENYDEWLGKMEQLYGKSHSVTPLEEGVFKGSGIDYGFIIIGPA